MNKRIFAFIMAVMMMISCMSFAEEIPTEDSYIPVEETQQAEEAPVVTEPVTEEMPEELPAGPAEEPAEEVIPAEIAEEETPAAPVEEKVTAESAEQETEEESPAESAEEVAEAEVPAEESPVEPVEEAAEEEIPAEPAEENSEEGTSEEPAEEAAEGDIPEEVIEEAAEEAASHFDSGYVQLKNGAKIYKAVGGGEAYGVLAETGNVYAENVVESEDPANDWIELTFAFEGSICRGYVKFARVRVLDDSEAQQAVDTARGLSSTLWDGNIAVMALRFAVLEAEQPEEIGSEENESDAAEAETVETDITECGTTESEEVEFDAAEQETAVLPADIRVGSNISTENIAPQIVTQPVNFTGNIGDTASFAVEAVGDGLTYQWKYRSKGKTAWTNASVTGAKTASMRAEMTDTRVKLEYCCFITDSHGQTVQSDIVCMEKKASFEIVTQPVNCEGKIGSEAVFSVEATGDGLTYQWKFRKKGATGWSNASMNGSKTATMNGEIIAARLNYEYCCVITDASGATCRTDVVCMLKAEPLAIKTQPVNYVGKIGDPAAFTVEATGKGLTYQWKYRTIGKTAWTNATMTGNKTATMTGEMTSTRVKLEYCCFVTDAFGDTVQTNVVCMKEDVKFEIVSQPVDYVGNIGDNATFTVEVTGSGLTYLWKMRIKNKSDWSSCGMSGKTTANLSGEMTSARVKYEYCCFITDSTGRTLQTDVVCMKEDVKFEIVSQPVDYVGNIGDNAAFTVEATGTGLTYLWKYRVKGKTAWANAGMTGKTTAKMTGEMTKARLGYEYCCVIKDASGATLQTDVVCMVEKIPLVITEEPQDAVITGGDAVFTVAATGNEPTYLWQTKMPGDEDWSDTACTADTFTVAAADCVNGMEVRCVVTDGYGDSITSAAVTLTVLAAEITDCIVTAENEVQLTVDCSAAGVEFRVIEVLDEEEILVTTSSETVITLQNVTLGEHTYYVSVYYEGEDLIDTEPVSILCDKAKVNDVLYTLGEDDKLTVTGYTGTASSLVIPETVDGFTVTAVGASAFEGNTVLHEIDLPDTITAIGSRAFKNCSNLSGMH